MAPGASSPLVDLRVQIIENCEFVSVPHARISLVIAKEPLGNFKAIVLRTDYNVRVALLSETAPSLDDALQALHVRSAEAVQDYIGTNGFALRSSKRRSRDIGYDSDSASSTVTLDDCESLSDNETVSVTSVGRAKRSSRRKADKAAKRSAGKHKARHGRSRSRSRSRSPSFSTTRARSRSICSSSSESELHYDPPTMPPRRAPFLNGITQRMPPRPPPNAFSAFTMGPPPPPPPPAGIPGGIPHSNYGPPNMNTNDNKHVNHPQPPLLPLPRPPIPGAFTFPKLPHNNPPPPPPATSTTTITPAPTPTSLPTNFPPIQHHHHQQALQHQPHPIAHPHPHHHHPHHHHHHPPPPPPPQQQQQQPHHQQPHHQQPHHQQPPHQHDLILDITWPHHGTRRTVIQTPHLSTRHIQHAALAFARRQAATFEGVPGSREQGGAAYRGVVGGLRAAVVRGVTVLGGYEGDHGGGDGGRCDLSGWAGDDLGGLVRGLVASSGGGGGKGLGVVLRFEVEVGSGGSGNGNGEGSAYAMLVPPPPRMSPGSGVSPGGGSPHGIAGAGAGPGQRMVFPMPGVISN